MSKRLEMLEKMTASGNADAFAWYGLAMEYRSLGRTQESLSTFERLRELDPNYLPMYLMAGQLLIEQAKPTDAAEWLKQGIELARRKGDTKALGELSDALAETGSDA